MKTMTALVWSLRFPMLTFFPSARFCLPLVLLPLSLCFFLFLFSTHVHSLCFSPFFLFFPFFPAVSLLSSSVSLVQLEAKLLLGDEDDGEADSRSSLFFSSSSILPSLCFFAFCVFLNLFPSLCFPYAFTSSPLPPRGPLCSVSPLAFIARGCMRYCVKIVTTGMH